MKIWSNVNISEIFQEQQQWRFNRNFHIIFGLLASTEEKDRKENGTQQRSLHQKQEQIHSTGRGGQKYPLSPEKQPK